MKRIFLFIFVAISVLLSYAQSADGRYSSRMTRDGMLFFVNPQKLGDLEGLKRFEYDMTLLSWTDSVTINFTFESNLMARIDNLEIRSGNEVFLPIDYSVLFSDIKKNRYEIRITSKFPLSSLIKALESPEPMRFVFMQDGTERSAAYKTGAWRKDSKKLNDIIRLYLYSRN